MRFVRLRAAWYEHSIEAFRRTNCYAFPADYRNSACQSQLAYPRYDSGGKIVVIENPGFDDLMKLFHIVFELGSEEGDLTFLVDLPDVHLPDNERWSDRRLIAAEWFALLTSRLHDTPFRAINLCTYANVGSNNNDLPPIVTKVNQFLGDASLAGGKPVPLDEILSSSGIVIALTEMSATAPLKMLAKRFKFRGASMPGFLRSMMPTLLINYEDVHARVVQLKEKMDKAVSAKVILQSNSTSYTSVYDLRFRNGHASGGLIREQGIVANLPSGEAFITPYEGERKEEPSRTSGLLPVQFGEEIVVYRLENNRAIDIESRGRFSELEMTKLKEEPAYGNIAELGMGILSEWGVQPVGSILLDEKCGLHIAFGRSEHFGGITSPSSFNNPRNVVHIDRVYLPSLQPQISVKSVTFIYPESEEEIMADGKYLV